MRLRPAAEAVDCCLSQAATPAGQPKTAKTSTLRYPELVVGRGCQQHTDEKTMMTQITLRITRSHLNYLLSDEDIVVGLRGLFTALKERHRQESRGTKATS